MSLRSSASALSALATLAIASNVFASDPDAGAPEDTPPPAAVIDEAVSFYFDCQPGAGELGLPSVCEHIQYPFGCRAGDERLDATRMAQRLMRLRTFIDPDLADEIVTRAAMRIEADPTVSGWTAGLTEEARGLEAQRRITPSQLVDVERLMRSVADGQCPPDAEGPKAALGDRAKALLQSSPNPTIATARFRGLSTDPVECARLRGEGHGVAAETKLRFAPGAEDEVVTFRFELERLEGDDHLMSVEELDWDVYMRVGDEVLFEPSRFGDFAVAFDDSLEGIDEGGAELQVDVSRLGDQEVSVGFLSHNCGDYRIRATSQPGSLEGDTAYRAVRLTDLGEARASGGCSATGGPVGTSGGLLSLGMLVAAVALSRRRRVS
jgi:MYXO-CTERM domain-containing protein